MGAPRIGIALGSGAARGWAHIGVLRALAAAGIHPTIVCGTSAGAFVGAAYVTGNLARLETWGRSLSPRDVLRMMDVTLGSGGMLAGERIMEFLREHGRDVRVEDLPRAYAAVATELSSGREVWLQRGTLLDAVRASMAFPGLLTPVRAEDGWLVDGGLVNPVPVSVCRAMGADLVIAVNLNAELFSVTRNSTGSERVRDTSSMIWSALSSGLQGFKLARGGADRREESKAPSVFEVLAGSIHIMQDRITRSRMAGDPPDLLLTPHLSHIRLMDFDKAADAIDRGETSVKEAMSVIREHFSRFEDTGD